MSIKILEQAEEKIKQNFIKADIGFPSESCMVVNIKHKQHLCSIVLDIVNDKLVLYAEFGVLGKKYIDENNVYSKLTCYMEDLGYVCVDLVVDVVNRFINSIKNDEYYPRKTIDDLNNQKNMAKNDDVSLFAMYNMCIM